MPGFESGAYPTLKENYCRNPQGYGDSPWCYTDMKTREVAKCSVPKCGENVPSEHNYLSLYLTLTMLFIAAVIVVVVAMRRYFMAHRGVNDTTPYWVYGLTSSEQVQRLLNENSDM